MEQPRDTAICVPVLFVWVLGQALVLALAAADARLTAQGWGAGGARALATGLMWGAQVMLGATLFPELVRTWKSAVAAMAVAFPMAQFAAALAGRGWAGTAMMVGLVGGLYGLNKLSRGGGSWLRALLGAYVFGTMAMGYLLQDFRPMSDWGVMVWRLGPMGWM